MRITWRPYATDGFMEQDLPGQCPECNHDMYFSKPEVQPVGFGNYPLGGHRNSLKPNQTSCLVFECPECFTMSVCHATNDELNDAAKQAHLEFIKGE